MIGRKSNTYRERITPLTIRPSIHSSKAAFTKPNFDPRNPTIKRRMAANRSTIPTLTETDFEGIIDETRIGLKGSPTHVKKSFVPVKNRHGEIIKEETVEDSSAKLIQILSDTHVI